MSTIGTSRKSTHSRQASTTAIPKPHVDIDTRSDVIPDLEEHHPNDATKGPKPHYTLFIRLPFPRGDFQDPPPISWDASKDKQLWKCISSGTSKDLNWKVLSIQFDVPLSFLLQQAAWLYERHFEGMKKGMMRLGAGTGSGTPSPLPQGVDGSAIAEEGDVTSRGGVAMERAGSRGLKIRTDHLVQILMIIIQTLRSRLRSFPRSQDHIYILRKLDLPHRLRGSVLECRERLRLLL